MSAVHDETTKDEQERRGPEETSSDDRSEYTIHNLFIIDVKLITHYSMIERFILYCCVIRIYI